MRYLACPLALIALFILVDAGEAWEANYPSGPVRQTTKQNPKQENIKLRTPPSAQQGDLQTLTGNKSLLTASDPTFAGVFNRRTVAYPTPDGVDLGHGWDFLLNQKKFISCVQFKKIEDNKYQTVD